MPSGQFTIDAHIWGDRWQHHRGRDHYGAQSDSSVALSSDIGKYPAGTPVHAVLADMVLRLLQLESYERGSGSFTVDAEISDKVFSIDAVIQKEATGQFFIDAELNRVGSFTIDALIVGRFTIDAVIV